MINKKGQTVPNYNHCTIHFKTKKAYEYFCQLTPIMESRAVTKYGERKPLMIWEELEAIASEIVLGSGCLGGLVQRYVAQGDLQKAKIMYEKMRSLVGQDSWYVEIFPHTLDSEWKKPGKDDKGDYVPGFFKPNECVDGQPRDKQMAPNKFLLNMAKRYGDRCLVSEDCLEKGTLIRTKDLGYIPIERIYAGMEVMTHKGRYKKVTKTRSVCTDKNKIKLCFRGNSELVCTEDHKILVKKSKKYAAGSYDQNFHAAPAEWVSAKDITEGFFVLTPYGEKKSGDEKNNKIDLSLYAHHNVKKYLTIGKEEITTKSNFGNECTYKRYIEIDEDM
jgi:hypothetical protein